MKVVVSLPRYQETTLNETFFEDWLYSFWKASLAACRQNTDAHVMTSNCTPRCGSRDVTALVFKDTRKRMFMTALLKNWKQLKCATVEEERTSGVDAVRYYTAV